MGVRVRAMDRINHDVASPASGCDTPNVSMMDYVEAWHDL